MSKSLMAKYLISDLFSRAPQHTWLTNEEIYDRIYDSSDVTFKTVQNVTSGLKAFGGLRSKRVGNTLSYTRTSRVAVESAKAYQF